MAESGCSVGATEPHCRDCWTKSTQNRSHEITRSVTTAPIPDQESTHPGAPGRILHPCEHADLCSQIRFSTLPTWRDIVNAEYTTRTPAFSESNIVTFRGIFSIPRKGNAPVVVLRIVRHIRLSLISVVLRLFSMFPAGLPGIAL